ncbi:hypothetical protein D3C73_1223370 [compost metagenome]
MGFSCTKIVCMARMKDIKTTIGKHNPLFFSDVIAEHLEIIQVYDYLIIIVVELPR